MNPLQESLLALKAEFLQQAGDISSQTEIEDLRIRYLGKKGELTKILRGMGALSAEERPVVGQTANEVRAEIEQKLSERQAELCRPKEGPWVDVIL